MNFLTENIVRFLMNSGGPLDRDKWEDESDGMDFTEQPPDLPDLDVEPLQMAGAGALMLILKYVAIALLVGLLIYIIVRLIARRRELQNGNQSNVKTASDTDDGPTATSPMDVLWNSYNESKAKGDYREAVRILHQIVIKHLDLLGKLKATTDKTNREYLNEFSWKEKALEFSQLTILHEFIWYGGKSVQKTDFDLAEPKFINFIQSLKNE